MFFNKPKEEPQAPKLQGEDFDMFPKMEGYKYSKEAADDQEPAEEAAPPEPTEFQKKLDALTPEKWKQYQILAGTVLGLFCSLSLGVLNRTKTFGSYGFIIAVVLALFVPNMLEKQAGRKIPALRTALIITIVIFLGLYMFYGMVINPDFFKTTQQ